MREITAESAPILDTWGPDILLGKNIWTPLEWVQWYYKMKIKYGQEAAVKNFAEWFDSSTYGAQQLRYPLENPEFKALVIKEGIAGKSTNITKLFAYEQFFQSIHEPFESIGSAISDAVEALANGAATLKIVVPFAVAAVAIILVMGLNKKVSA